MSYDNSNSGTLGKNRYKEKNGQPDVTGTIKEVSDEAHELIGKTGVIPLSWWTKTSKDGERFMSGGIDMYRLRKLAAENEAPNVNPARNMPEKMSPSEIPRGGMDDDIPFARERSWP